MDTSTFMALALACAPQVDATTTQALVAVESSHNPYAIGVVQGALLRQPRHLAEAQATAHQLQRDGRNFSVGLAQINVHQFDRLGLTLSKAFDPCTNLQAMQAVLAGCYARALPQHPAPAALRHALSCYYSGNFSTGYRHGYVQRVAAAARSARAARFPASDIHTYLPTPETPR
ncbi:transglycosylase family protein [Burkholderiales bacterium JOSHI_001]|nr:transglycosylase family protein [Burkholderiales bacterium JOSHI_001]